MLRFPGRSARRDAGIAGLAFQSGVGPVLMDVGAAGTSPAVWQSIAAASTLIGFEPDARNPDPSFGRNFARAILVNRAVVPNDTDDAADFILTEYPSCSSMLEADLVSLGSFAFRDYFKPVRRVSVQATSLNRVVADHGLAGINWLKVDSQGLDLRILKSLSAGNLDRLLAVDIEPGLIDAYKQEDLFPECHSWLKSNGFWMAQLACQTHVKIRPETVERLKAAGYDRRSMRSKLHILMVAFARQSYNKIKRKSVGRFKATVDDRRSMLSKLHKSPICVEGRYLREVSWLEKHVEDKQLWIVAILFGLCADQLGHVFDLIGACEAKFGLDTVLEGADRLARSLLRDATG
jgi:FkbM family methyltransferase